MSAPTQAVDSLLISICHVICLWHRIVIVDTGKCDAISDGYSRVRYVTIENICQNHLRRLAGGGLDMFTNISKKELRKRLKLVYRYRADLNRARAKKP
jgi:hypothetical protein